MELLGNGPLSRWGPGAFFVCRWVICQAVVAEVEPLRLKGYDPRSAVCVCVCVSALSAGDPPRAQVYYGLSSKEWASRLGQGTTKASSAYFR